MKEKEAQKALANYQSAMEVFKNLVAVRDKVVQMHSIYHQNNNEEFAEKAKKIILSRGLIESVYFIAFMDDSVQKAIEAATDVFSELANMFAMKATETTDWQAEFVSAWTEQLNRHIKVAIRNAKDAKEKHDFIVG